MSIFEGAFGGPIFKNGCAIALALTYLAACSGSGGGTGLPSGANASTNVQSELLTSKDFKRLATFGSKGQIAVAQCPQGYKVVAGGSSSSDGSSVGTGYAESNRNGWVVKPNGSASAEAFATCISKADKGKFQWRYAPPISGLAGAQCRKGYTLVTGYSDGTATASWFDSSTNTYWVGGGGEAWASCARNSAGIVIKHAWNQSQKPKNVYAGCGSGYTVIGGAMGNNAWPGPPIQEHPGVESGPGNHGYDGFWTFSDATNELTWAACVKTAS
jgi:hypothetical protein